MQTLLTLSQAEEARCIQLRDVNYALSRAYSLPKILFESTAWTPEMEVLSRQLTDGKGFAGLAHRLFEESHGHYMRLYNDVIVNAYKEGRIKEKPRILSRAVQHWLEHEDPYAPLLRGNDHIGLDGELIQNAEEMDAFTIFMWLGLMQEDAGQGSLLRQFLEGIGDSQYKAYENDAGSSHLLWRGVERLLPLIGHWREEHDPLDFDTGIGEQVAPYLAIDWASEAAAIDEAWLHEPAWQALELRAAAQAIRRQHQLLPEKNWTEKSLALLLLNDPCGELKIYKAEHYPANIALMAVLQPNYAPTHYVMRMIPEQDWTKDQREAARAAQYLDRLAEVICPVKELVSADDHILHQLGDEAALQPASKRLVGELLSHINDNGYEADMSHVIARCEAMLAMRSAEMDGGYQSI